MQTGAIDDAHFAKLMVSVGPFAAPPRLAVATSGGADSLALCLLAARWVGRRQGKLTALTIDHGLRPDAATEAREVGRWLRLRSIPHRILRWTGAKPTTGIQTAARSARYRMLSAWCRDHRIVHLLLGHHLDDQAETLLMRLARGSGFDGLAAMPLVVERDGVRYLRPCLTTSHTQLVTTLEEGKQPWIDDPSNHDQRFARVRLRSQLVDGVLSSADVAKSARSIGQLRVAREAATSELLAMGTEIDPRGFCRFHRDALQNAKPDVIRRAVSRVIVCIGGGAYAPRRARVDTLVDDLRTNKEFSARTLGGCRVALHNENMIVCREVGRIGDPVPLEPGRTARWDNRYDLRLARGAHTGGLTVAALEGNRWPDREIEADTLDRHRLAPAVIASLPAVFHETKLVAVPHLGLYDPRIVVNQRALRTEFAPRNHLTPARFSVA